MKVSHRKKETSERNLDLRFDGSRSRSFDSVCLFLWKKCKQKIHAKKRSDPIAFYLGGLFMVINTIVHLIWGIRIWFHQKVQLPRDFKDGGKKKTRESRKSVIINNYEFNNMYLFRPKKNWFLKNQLMLSSLLSVKMIIR